MTVLHVFYRNNVKEAGDKVTVFNSDTIKTNPRVSLGREGLFLMAILCGGDYDKVSHFNLFLFSYSNLNIRSDLMVVDGKLHIYSLKVNSQHHYSELHQLRLLGQGCVIFFVTGGTNSVLF